MHKTRTTELQNQLKLTENELRMNVGLSTLYLNNFNERKRMFGRTLRKLF